MSHTVAFFWSGESLLRVWAISYLAISMKINAANLSFPSRKMLQVSVKTHAWPRILALLHPQCKKDGIWHWFLCVGAHVRIPSCPDLCMSHLNVLWWCACWRPDLFSCCACWRPDLFLCCYWGVTYGSLTRHMVKCRPLSQCCRQKCAALCVGLVGFNQLISWVLDDWCYGYV